MGSSKLLICLNRFIYIWTVIGMGRDGSRFMPPEIFWMSERMQISGSGLLWSVIRSCMFFWYILAYDGILCYSMIAPSWTILSYDLCQCHTVTPEIGEAVYPKSVVHGPMVAEMTILRSGSWGILGYTPLTQFNHPNSPLPAFQHGQFIFSTDLRTWDIHGHTGSFSKTSKPRILNALWP